MNRTLETIDTIVVHCSDSLWGDAAEIDRWHRAPPRNWNGIGYHYVILNGYPSYDQLTAGDDGFDHAMDGLVEDGRRITEIGAHVKGHNETSLGICLIGKMHFTCCQLMALQKLVLRLRSELSIMRVLGHYELDDGKTCPNLNMDWVRGTFLGMPMKSYAEIPTV